MAVSETSNGNVRDYLISINELNRPTVVDMTIIKPGVMNSAVTMIARLILMRKGTIPDLPDLGIDIVGRYRFAFVEELYTLQREIENQMTVYLPEFAVVNVEVQYGENTKIVIIQITIDDTTYQLSYDVVTETLTDLMSQQV